MNNKFKHWTDADIVDLIKEAPLAFMVSSPASEFMMTPLPMLPETDGDGCLVRLTGHMALRNPHVGLLRRHPLARFLFLGPNGYISPSYLTDRSWAPTWNYTILSIEAKVKFTPDLNDTALRQLVAALESGKANAWSVDELGERYQQLSQRIIAFQAEIRSVDATFKLGQDEKPGVFQQIINGLDQGPLQQWMQRFNPDSN